ncbi:BT4734/BF3469 family protein [Pedobacter mucosus]|uniref:BT4734/BF3469 family protein n=1 Tax=Pedobacter mucosus TaxID=2895286 RepID=UPI001EE4373A|nr:BT4734/BF3469 family protein [Pedobacter mucosus]UKT62724.1 hypothetical protein LOK61_13235 [Pedobacter mucosus]
MPHPKFIKISWYDNMKSKTSYTIDLFAELRHIKQGTYKVLIESCRLAYQEGNYGLYNDLKSTLPCVTFSGIFNINRKATEIQTYNHIIVFDIDKIPDDRLQNLRNLLENDVKILALWLSPSGVGIKGLIATENSLPYHRATFDSLRFYLLANYSIALDDSGSDVSRLCFSSYDPEIYYNPNCLPYNDVLVLEANTEESELSEFNPPSFLKSAYQTEGLNKIHDRRLMKRILTYLEKKSLSITRTYDDWLRVALSISYTFSYDVGVKYFIKLCELDKELHSEQKSINLLKHCYEIRGSKKGVTISFGTILFFAMEKGFKTIKNK